VRLSREPQPTRPPNFKIQGSPPCALGVKIAFAVRSLSPPRPYVYGKAAPIDGTPAERYVRTRRIRRPLPATLRFRAGHRQRTPALLAAFEKARLIKAQAPAQRGRPGAHRLPRFIAKCGQDPPSLPGPRRRVLGPQRFL